MMRISVLGVGWLGFPLAGKLLSSGFQVKGSVTDRLKFTKMKEAGIKPFRLVLEPERIELDDPAFFETDLVIVAIPPRRTDDIESIFPAQISQLILLLEEHAVPRVLFISSTSVYNESDGIVDEEAVAVPEKASGKALLVAENLLLQNKNFQTTVLRFGGLIGADRNPARFLSRKKEAGDGSKPVNLIHLDDCIQIISEIIDQQVWGEVFNACCPQHPTRQEFYEKASVVSGIPAPVFIKEEASGYKIVDSNKLIRRLNYQFIFQNPMDYLESLP